MRKSWVLNTVLRWILSRLLFYNTFRKSISLSSTSSVSKLAFCWIKLIKSCTGIDPILLNPWIINSSWISTKNWGTWFEFCLFFRLIKWCSFSFEAKYLIKLVASFISISWWIFEAFKRNLFRFFLLKVIILCNKFSL